MSYITAIILIFMGFVAGAATISLCSINRAHDINAENDYLRAKYREISECAQRVLYYINRFDKAPQYRLSLYFERFPVTAELSQKEFEEFKSLRRSLSYLSVDRIPGKEDIK